MCALPVLFRLDRRAVAENFEEVVPRPENNTRCGLPDDEVSGTAHCRPFPGHEFDLKELKRIALFHYVTKSWEDFQAKIERGKDHKLRAYGY